MRARASSAGGTEGQGDDADGHIEDRLPAQGAHQASPITGASIQPTANCTQEAQPPDGDSPNSNTMAVETPNIIGVPAPVGRR